MFRLLVLVLTLSSWTIDEITGQSKRFGSGVFAGIGLAQIDGDDMQGYDKPGYNFGLKGIAFILPTLEIHTELSYSQRGSQSKDYARSNNRGRKLILDYGSISGLLVVNDWFHPIKEYYRLQVHGGVSIGRLIRVEPDDPITSDGRKINFNELLPYYNTTDFSMILGVNLKLTRNSGLTFRYNRGFNKIIDADEIAPFFVKRSLTSMKGYFISADIFYLF